MDKNNFTSLIQTICRLSVIARESGLLALDEECGERGEIEDALLEYGLSLIASGMFGETVREMIEAKAGDTYKTAEELLRKKIVIEGIMLIHDGEPTESLKEKLCSYLDG